MPSRITSSTQTSGGATFDIGPRQTGDGGSDPPSDTAGNPSGDSVDISNGSGSTGGRYTRPVSNRFQFDMQSGLFSTGRRYDANVQRFRTQSNATHRSRQAVSSHVSLHAGSSSPSTAMFALRYQAASPNRPASASHNAAITELNRQQSQSLNLLKLL
jgi:hypothetical protein